MNFVIYLHECSTYIGLYRRTNGSFSFSVDISWGVFSAQAYMLAASVFRLEKCMSVV